MINTNDTSWALAAINVLKDLLCDSDRINTETLTDT